MKLRELMFSSVLIRHFEFVYFSPRGHTDLTKARLNLYLVAVFFFLSTSLLKLCGRSSCIQPTLTIKKNFKHS